MDFDLQDYIAPNLNNKYLIYKEEKLFVLYAFGPRKSQYNQTLHGLLFRPGEGRGLFLFQKVWILHPKKSVCVPNQSDCSIQ